jgi:DNA processing protein
LVAWARLARTPRIGPLTFHKLLKRWRTPEAALNALPSITRGARLKPPPAQDIEAELDALEKIGARLLASCEPDYPKLLGQLGAPPPLLSARGDLALLNKPCVAMVGAREGSAAGLLLAERLAKDLGASGFVVVSGLARGIDAAAHRGALQSGTIAVLAGGLDKPYPPQNYALHDDIIAQGCVVAEAPLGFQARARDFPRRNHIISGLARGVVVIEAALRSGSLITARAAGEQGRDVMAVPGSPLDPRARGANALIKSGAALIEDAADAPMRFAAPGPLFETADEDDAPKGLAKRLAELLSPTPVHVNDLARLTAAPAGAVAAALVELELEGRAASLPGGFAGLPRAGFSAGD